MRIVFLGLITLATVGAFIYESTKFLGHKKFSFENDKLHIFPQGRLLKDSTLLSRSIELRKVALKKEWQKLLDTDLFSKFDQISQSEKSWIREEALWSEYQSKGSSSLEIKQWINRTRHHLFSKYSVK